MPPATAREPAPMRIGLYIRSATDSDALDEQETRLRGAVADLTCSQVITRVFRDAATSGLTLDRPGLRDLLAVAAAREIDVVMVTGLYPLSRSPRHLAQLRHVLAAHGVRITTPDEEGEPAFAALAHHAPTLDL
jgi:site-specific DNA recombinase